ncbi:MAG: YHYH protein [Thermoplasmatota archaeon]
MRKRRHRATFVVAWVLLAMAGCMNGAGPSSSSKGNSDGTPNSSAGTAAAGGALDLHALPLGDGHVSQTTPASGSVFSCPMSAHGGASNPGPWIHSANGTWDATAKMHVEGTIAWPQARYNVTTVGSVRTLHFNDLPLNHTTGTFPIAPTDPAYAYDQNPNHITAQDVTWSLLTSPTAASKPSCLPGGPIGVLSDGVYLFDALDGESRDAVAHEVLDACDGHPEMSGSYHHHDIPACILSKAPNGTATLAGFAIDGYGIYIVKDSNGTMPRNADVDVCHGTTSVVPWNGGLASVYHYVATLEYPYTLGCFHGTPLQLQGGP